jgi:hypothetical protein
MFGDDGGRGGGAAPHASKGIPCNNVKGDRMKGTHTLGSEFLKELEAESAACRKCLERIPERLFDWKPHEKSMPLGYLSLLVAEIPLWIHQMVETSEIDFAKFQHFQPKNTAELVRHFDENLTCA